MLAKDVIIQARYKLGDVHGDRWSDERLLLLLDQGLRDIARQTTLFVETTFYTVLNLVVDIDLSDRAVKILRAEYLDEPIEFYTFEEMDYKDKDWQLETGDEVKALIYNKQAAGVLKQYPIVSNVYNPHIEIDSEYGITTDISYSDYQISLADSIGDLAGVPAEAIIKFYYIRRHDKVTDIETTLNVDDMLEEPLISYVVGKALRDGLDAQNRNMGNEELQMYNKLIDDYNIEKSQLFVRADHEARYRPND